MVKVAYVMPPIFWRFYDLIQLNRQKRIPIAAVCQFASFFSSGFITAVVVNTTKCTSVQCITTVIGILFYGRDVITPGLGSQSSV